MGGVCVCVKGGVRVGQGMGSVNIFLHHNEDLLHILPIIIARLLSLSLSLSLSHATFSSASESVCVCVARRKRDEGRTSLVFYVYK